MKTCFGQVLAYHTHFSSLVREKSTCCFVPESRNKRRNTKKRRKNEEKRKEYIKKNHSGRKKFYRPLRAPLIQSKEKYKIIIQVSISAK